MAQKSPNHRPMAVGDIVTYLHPVLGLITGEIITLYRAPSGPLWVKLHTGTTAIRVRADKLSPLPPPQSS